MHGPSRCFCCLDGLEDSLEHMFWEGEIAQEVWKFFANSCGVSLRLEGWRRMLGEWWQGGVKRQPSLCSFTIGAWVRGLMARRGKKQSTGLDRAPDQDVLVLDPPLFDQ